MKTISVIIPTYNRADYIVEAIESVLQQKTAGWDMEVIVVDDGSTDSTKDVLKKFGSKIQYIEIPHSGKPAVARNAGLKAAKGELIALQDSDDKWVENKLTTQLHVFEDHGVVFSYGNAEFMKSNGARTGELIIEKDKLSDGEKFKKLIQNNCISTLTVMFRRLVIDTVGNFDEADGLRAIEDYNLWLRILVSYPKGFKHVDATLAYYRRHDQNISSANNSLALNRLNNVYSQLWGEKLSDSQRKIVEQRIEDCNISLSYALNTELKDSKTLVSVIMGVYNGEDFLRQSIESILNQTLKNIEFIIIDDGSNDSSVKIIREYNDPRIRLIHQQNHGLVYSLNKAIRISRSSYIARQDADDISLPSRLEKEVQLMASNEKLGVIGTFFTYINEKTLEPSITITGPTKSIDIKRALYSNNPLGHGSVMLRKSIFDSIEPYTDDYGPTEDFELWRRVAQKWDFGIVPESLYLYRLNPDGISHTKSKIQHKYSAQIIAEQWKKPFIYKGLKHIVQDGHYYKNSSSVLSHQVYEQYISQQIDITKMLFKHRNIRFGFVTGFAIIWLEPGIWKRFAKPIVHRILRRLRLRSY